MNKLIFKLLVLITLFITSPYLSANEKPTISELNIGWYFPSINALVSRTDFYVTINLWLDEFNENLNIGKTNVVLFDHIKNMQKAFKRGDLSIIVAPPLLIVENFNLNKLADGFTGTSVTGKPYGMAVLARKNSDIKSLKDVKNKRLALPKNDELAQVFINSLIIPEYHQSYQQVFKSTRYFLKQHSIIHQLFFNKADVGVAYLETFNLMVELNPQIKKEI
ncbi:MAG: PhnD/SsuA/transferrin family substrate-binding protein, partial [Methylococcales bacterium]